MAAPFRPCRSIRRCSVRSPRRTRKQSSGPGTAPIAFWRNRSRSATAGPTSTATPTIVSEWPARYFVAEWNTTSAPIVSGRWTAGDANVLSTTISGRRPPSATRRATTSATAAMSIDLEVRIRRRLEPDKPRALGQRLPQNVRAAGEIDVARLDPSASPNPLEVAERAAIHVIADHDLVAWRGELRKRRGHGGPGGEGDAVGPALECRDRPFEPFSRGVLRAGVLVPTTRPRDAVLRVCRGLVDRRRDRAGQLVGLGARVDGQRVERGNPVGLVHRRMMASSDVSRSRLRPPGHRDRRRAPRRRGRPTARPSGESRTVR